MGCGWSLIDDEGSIISSEIVEHITEQFDIEMTDKQRVEKWLDNSGVTFTIDGNTSNYTKLRRDSFSN
jgi:hypothetical protein